MTTTVTPATRRWAVDPAQSVVEFSVPTFWGLTAVKGQFDRFEGSYVRGAVGEIELEIDATSLDTGNQMRDKHLKSEDFFAIDDHPTVRFTSTNVVEKLDGTLLVTGELGVAETTVPISFTATVLDEGDSLEIETTLTVDQMEFGMSSGMLGMIRRPATLHVKTRLN